MTTIAPPAPAPVEARPMSPHMAPIYREDVRQLLDGRDMNGHALAEHESFFEELYHASYTSGATPQDAARALAALLGHPLGTTLATRYQQWLAHTIHQEAPVPDLLPPASPARVQHWMRLQFEDRIRHAVTGLTEVGDVCGAARDIAQLYPWATRSDLANALVNILGTGWGAIYLDWSYRNHGRTDRA